MTDLTLIRPGARAFARRTAGAVLATLCFAMAPALVSAAGADQRTESAAIEAMKSDFEAIGEQTRDNPVAVIDPFEVGPPAADEPGRMHQVVRQFLNSMFRVRNAYLAELEAVGWNAILDANRLKADAGMVESRRLIGLAREAGARAESDSVAAFNGFPQLVEAAPLLASNKRDMIAGFEESKARGLAEMRGSFELEAQTVDEFEAMVELLGRTKWEVEDAQIAFHADADVAAFNAHFERIQALTRELQSLQQASVDRARQKLGESQD